MPKKPKNSGLRVWPTHHWRVRPTQARVNIPPLDSGDSIPINEICLSFNCHEIGILSPEFRNPLVIQDYNKVWQEASWKVINKINSDTISTQVPKEAIKIILRAFADNNEQKFCEMLLRSFENQFDPIPKITWKSNYKIKYPM